MYACFVSSCLVVSNTAIYCLEKLISEMTYCVSSGKLNLTHSLNDLIWCVVSGSAISCKMRSGGQKGGACTLMVPCRVLYSFP